VDLTWRGILEGLFRGPRAAAGERPAPPRREAPLPTRIPVQLRWEPERGEWSSDPGVVCGAAANEVTVRTPRRLDVGRAVWIMRPGATALKTVADDVRPQGDEWLIRLRLIAQERRRRDRYPFNSGGMLRWAGVDGAAERLRVDVRNFSDWGAQLESARPAPVGQPVWLCGESVECEGSVRYCVPSGEMHLIGVQFLERPALSSDSSSGG